jgi:hypothetical protein
MIKIYKEEKFKPEKVRICDINQGYGDKIRISKPDRCYNIITIGEPG